MGEGNTRTYIGCLAVFALALSATWVYWYGVELELRLVIASAVFALLLCCIRLFPINVSDRWNIDASDVVFVGTVVMLGPVWASVASLPYALMVSRGDVLRGVYELSQNLIMIYLAALVFTAASGPLLLQQGQAVAPVVFATLAAAVVFAGLNSAMGVTLLRIKYGQSFRQGWRDHVEPYLLSDSITVLTAGFGVMALLIYGPVAAIVAVSGSIVSQVIVYRSRDKVAENRELRDRVSSLEGSLALANLSFGTIMIEDLGRRDGFTHLHAAATSVYAADIAKEMDFDPHRQRLVGMAGLLHNIGLFGMPPELLTATGELNSIAKTRLREHPLRGEAALKSVPEFSEMAGWVRWHHERPDGRGYPDRLRSNWIPLEARILAVAESYAAMVLDKPSRPKLDFAAARTELNAGTGTYFDEVVVRAFLRILDTESEGYRMADDHRFAFPPDTGQAAGQVSPESLRSAEKPV